jgi:DNA-binding transcriptional ArsR family regulator/rhodanese-related sulfurtransferase
MNNKTTETRPFKDQVFTELERIGKALGSRRRLELLDLLSQGPHSVEELAAELGVSVASASQHLQKLKQANLVSSTREGSYVYYQVANDEVADFYAGLRRLAQAQLPGLESTVRAHFGDDSPTVDDPQAAVEQVRLGEAVLIDTRPRGEFEAGHVAQAQSIPLDELDERLGDLPRDRRIFAYCRGPFCTFAEEAVKRLRQEGFDAARLDLGVADFRRFGAEIAVG